MNSPPPSDPTVAYYDRNAEAYCEGTLGVRMGALYEPFLALVPAGGHILDAGCGSGRDAREFLRRGYAVTAIDASAGLARVAVAPVTVLRFEGMDWEGRFDGVWACASLLHVRRAEIDGVLGRFTKALRPAGVWYMSFKLGEAEEVREGRLFSDYTERSLRELVGRHPLLEFVRVWVTDDVRPGQSGQRWLNALVRKVNVPGGRR
jgi:SAM-dependent methyltransferase